MNIMSLSNNKHIEHSIHDTAINCYHKKTYNTNNYFYNDNFNSG